MTAYVKAIDNMTNVTDGDLRTITTDFLYQEGVIDLSGGHLEVSEKGTPDMSVDVAAGRCYVENDAWTEFSSAIKYWEVLSDATENVAISSNSSGSTRNDIICVKIDDSVSPGADGEDAVSIIAVEGTPGAGVPATPDDHLKLAEVEVANGASSITNSEITDSRQEAAWNLAPQKLGSDAQGDTFYRSSSGRITRLGPGTDGQLLKTQGAGANPMWDDVISSGMLMQFAGSSAPSGWLLCDGSAVSRTTYSDLFSEIGTTYGSGDGSTTFNVPDLRGRLPLGKDNMGGSSANRVTNSEADSLGGSEGDENKNLQHSHTVLEIGTEHYDWYGSAGTSGTPPGVDRLVARHDHPDTGNAGSATQDIMPPYLTLNYIIKT